MPTAESPVQSKEHPAEPGDLNMPAQKKQRTKGVKTAASGSVTSSSSTHSYLGKREVSSIEYWNNHIPAKPTPTTDLLKEQELVVQAYVQAKLALFRSVPTERRKT